MRGQKRTINPTEKFKKIIKNIRQLLMKKQHKIEPGVCEALMDVARQLPVLYKMKNGKQLFKVTKQKVKGHELSAEEVKKVKNFVSTNTYEIVRTTPLIVNHYEILLGLYRKGGREAADAYVDRIIQNANGEVKPESSSPILQIVK